MDDLSKKLEKLGEAVSDVADRTTDPAELAAARERWQLGAAPRRRWGRPVVLAAAACLVAIFVAFFVPHRGGPVSFVLGSPPARGDVGAWVAADHAAPLHMQFSEGTSFTLSPGARVRVTETTSRGATVLLERGTVGAEVVHAGPDTRWNVQAGPFEVHVTGTAFDASWDPNSEVFSLAMRSGVVVVQGPLLQPGREIRAGEVLRVSVRDGSLELRAGTADAAVTSAQPSAPPPSPPAAPIASSQEAPPTASPPAAPAPPEGPSPAALARSGAAPAPPSQEPGWRDLAAAGKYGDALAAAERSGFDQEVERASSQDLVLLADAARYAARPALARQALLAQRRRFGVRGSSAFVLGKIAADQQGAAADAVRWFETYLSEEPNGALAEQALGRILELKRGDAASARATAERYLARYPHGAHAALARSLLSP